MSSIKPYNTYTSNDQIPYVNSTSVFGYFGSAGTRNTWYSLPTTLLTNNEIASVNADTGLRIFKPGIYTLNLSLDPESGGEGNAQNAIIFNFGTTRLIDLGYTLISGSFGGVETSRMFSFGSNSTTYPGIIEWIANGYSSGTANISQFAIVSNQLVYAYFSRINSVGNLYPGICTTEITFIINQDTTIYFNVFCANTITIGRSYFTLELIQAFPTLPSRITNNTETANFYDIASSSTGQYLFAPPKYNQAEIFKSSDYGVSFVSIPCSVVFFCIASDSAGVNLVAGAFNNGSIYWSNNSGSSWNISSGPNTQWNDIASSSTGQFVVAVGENTGIYRSTNFGVSWNLNYSTIKFISIASSSTGQNLVAGASSGFIYTSSDSGTNWTARTALGSREWQVACDSTGQFIVAAGSASNSLVYISNNGGTDFFLTNLPTTSLTSQDGPVPIFWNYVASNSTGEYLVAVGSQSYNFPRGETYISSTSGAVWNKVMKGNEHLGGTRVASNSSGSQFVVVGSAFSSSLGINVYKYP